VAKGRDNWMTSIVIKDKGPFTSHFFSFFNRYDIYYTKDFNPNTNEYEIASHNCPKVGIAEILIDLSKKYYQLLNTVKLSPKENHNTSIRQKNKEKKVYQCNKCFTVYDKDFGDIMSGIPALIPFEHLPENYSCYTCGNEKDDFSVVTIKENVFK
jgi:rubredoxin